jgi:hypothetical protein
MTLARQVARDEMGLEQLRLAVRGGCGLEPFYARLGWKEIGRWPGALRLAPGDDRPTYSWSLARSDPCARPREPAGGRSRVTGWRLRARGTVAI